jgi:hypothetical protein
MNSAGSLRKRHILPEEFGQASTHGDTTYTRTVSTSHHVAARKTVD